MRIESGPSISVAAAPAISAAVNVGSVARIGSLEGFRPMGVGDIATPSVGGMLKHAGQLESAKPLVFTPTLELNVTDVVGEAESIISQAQRPLAQQDVLAEANYWLGIKDVSPAELIPFVPVRATPTKFEPVIVPQVEPVVVPLAVPNGFEYPRPQVMISPILEPATKTEDAPVTQIGSQVSIESRVSHQTVPAVATQPALEEVVTQKVDKEKPVEGEEKEIAMKKKIHLVDKPVLTIVLSEIDEALEKGKAEAERLGLGRKIIGFLVAKFLPFQHEGNTGGAVKPHGVDGTIPARKKAIAARQEFSSEKEVKAVILANRPVTIGEEGEPSTQKEVDTTYQGRVVKPPKVIQIIEIRRRKKMIERKTQVPLVQDRVLAIINQESGPQPKEANLEGLGLAEVFSQKAA